ncbi:MAG: hypothetical protein ACKO5E_09370 [bacterium]
MPVKLNLWHIMLAVGTLAIGFSLWTTSEATRAMLVVMITGTAAVVVSLHGIMRLFLVLGHYGESPTRANLRRMLAQVAFILFYCALLVNFAIWLGFYLLWPRP